MTVEGSQDSGISRPSEVAQEDEGGVTAPGEPIRVFVLDDHEIVRRGLRQLIEAQPDMTIAGEASTCGEAILRVPPTRPDVAVLDVQLPDGDGIEVCRDLRSTHPELRCIMLTSFGGDEALTAAILAGAQAFVMKQVDAGGIVETIRRVAAGQSLIDPTAMARAMEQLRSQRRVEDRLELLTPRERRVLQLISEGWTNRHIGEELYLAEKTVKNCVSQILGKLGLSRRTEAAVFAVRTHASER